MPLLSIWTANCTPKALVPPCAFAGLLFPLEPFLPSPPAPKIWPLLPTSNLKSVPLGHRPVLNAHFLLLYDWSLGEFSDPILLLTWIITFFPPCQFDESNVFNKTQSTSKLVVFLTDENKALRQFANEKGYRLDVLRGKKWLPKNA